MNPRHLVGKTIARVDMNARKVLDNGGPRYVLMHFPVIHFTDGSALAFHAEENPDGDDYGTKFLYVKPKKRVNRRCACGHPWNDPIHKESSDDYEHLAFIEVIP